MRPHRRTAHLAGLAAAALFAMAGCGSGSDDQASDTPTADTPAMTSAEAAETSSEAAESTTDDDGEAASNPVITIKDFAYGNPLTVAPGTTITVINEDSTEHDVDATDGSSFATDLLGQGAQTTFNAPGAAGSYEFTCSEHPRMLGELIVQ